MFRKPRLASQKPSPRGDTILSVMISVVIIGSAIGTTYQLVNSSIRLGRSAHERGYAINTVNIQIERVKAVLDTNPDSIFEDSLGLLGTPATGFGNKFCLVFKSEAAALDPTVDAAVLSDEQTGPWPIIYMMVAGTDPMNTSHPDCQNGPEIGFPVVDAEPRVEVEYQKVSASATRPNDTDRFKITVHWTAIGSSRIESLTAYYRSHPLINQP